MEDRKIKTNSEGQPYSLNCEFWGPGFIFPYLTGRNAKEIYRMSINEVVNYLPFMTLKLRAECAQLLKKRLSELNLLNHEAKIDPLKFLEFSING
jgi:hypothetical protein